MTNWRDAGPELEAARAKLEECQQRVDVMPLEEVKAILKRHRAAQVFICGGDGTMSEGDLRSLAAEFLFLESEP